MRKHIHIFLIVLGILLLSIALYFIYREFHPDFQLLFDRKAPQGLFEKHIRSHGAPAAALLMLAAAILYMIPGLSNSFICIFIGVCYGPAVGVMLNLCSNMAGNIGLYTIATKVGLPKRWQRSSRFLDKIKQMKQPWLGLMIGYMVPVIPSILVNFMASKVHLRDWVLYLCMFFGVLPVSFLYAFGGDALFHGKNAKALALILGVALLTCLIVFFREEDKKHRAKKQRLSEQRKR